MRQGPGGAPTAVVPRARPAPRAISGGPALLGRWVRRAGIASAAGLLAVELIAPAWVDRAAEVLAVGGILIGLPHGAVDHLVPFWSTGRRVTRVALAAVLVRYIAVLVAALAAVLLFPLPTLWVFLGAAAVHFGRGEVMVAASFAGRPAPRPWQDLVPMAAHGTVAVGLPLGAWAAVSLPVLDQVAPGFAGTPAGVLDAFVTAPSHSWCWQVGC